MDKEAMDKSMELTENVNKRVNEIIAMEVDKGIKEALRGALQSMGALWGCEISIKFPRDKCIDGKENDVKQFTSPFPIWMPSSTIMEEGTLDHPNEEAVSEGMDQESKTEIEEDFHIISLEMRVIPRAWKAKCKTCGWSSKYQPEKEIAWFYAIRHQWESLKIDGTIRMEVPKNDEDD